MNCIAHVMGGEGLENMTNGNHLLYIGIYIGMDTKFRPIFGSNRIPNSTEYRLNIEYGGSRLYGSDDF